MGDGVGIRGSCAICQSTFISSSKVSALQCGHTFHFSCVSEWLAVKKECPNCRKKLSTKHGIIEKLFFDVQIFDGNDSQVEIDYQEKAEMLAEKVGKEKEAREEAEKKCEELKSKIKSLEKKVLKEKDKYDKEIPALRTRNHHLEMLSSEMDGLRSELERTKAMLKACNFYELLSYKNGEKNVEKSLSKYLKGNLALDTDKFFELMKAQNKELAAKRKEAVQQAESLKNEIRPLKKELKEKDDTIEALRREIKELREMANVDTPINKRLRSVLMAETPAQKKRISMGFDQTSVIDPSVLSFDEENQKAGSSTIILEDSDGEDSPIFKRLDRKRKRNSDIVAEEEEATEENDFSFDIEIPSAVRKRVTQQVKGPLKPLKKVNLSYTSPPEPRDLKRNMNEPKKKSGRLSNYFSRGPTITID